MAKIKLLIDTDVLIDSLKGIKPAKDLFRTKGIDLYCSILSKKELLSKSGLRESERRRIPNYRCQVPGPLLSPFAFDEKEKPDQRNKPEKPKKLKKPERQFSKRPYRFKPLRRPLQNKRRVHVGGSFVLVYEIDEDRKMVTLFDFDHHDNVYKP
jgi:mRNA-degrading endonuclease RelE of RelBE toxin-antitoxin system